MNTEFDPETTEDDALPPLDDEESEILERLEDADDIMPHAHHALVRSPFSWR
jgi:hypothetical protein